MTCTLHATLALSLAIGACAPSPGRATSPPEAGCSGESSQAETLGCYVQVAARSRAEVEAAFAQNLRIAMAQDGAFNAFARGHGLSGSSLAATLKASQAAWVKYSKAQCAFEGGSSFGGSGQDILEAACHDRLNARRLTELKAAADLFRP